MFAFRPTEILHCGVLWNWKLSGLHVDIHAGKALDPFIDACISFCFFFSKVDPFYSFILATDA